MRQSPTPLVYTVAAAPGLRRLVVLDLKGDELGIGRNPWQAGVGAEKSIAGPGWVCRRSTHTLVAQRLTTGEAGQVGQGLV